jgi:PAS domain S-box-containing protein
LLKKGWMKRETRKYQHDGSVSPHKDSPGETPVGDVSTDGLNQNIKVNLHRLNDPRVVAAESALEHMQMLHTIERALLQSNDIDDIGQNVLPLIPAMMHASWVGLAAASFTIGEMNFIAAYPANHQPGRGWRGQLEWNWSDTYEPPGPVHSIRDLAPIHNTSPFFSMLWEHGIQSLLTVPLLIHDRIWGFLILGRDTPYRWSLDDIHLAREIAAPLAIGVKRASEHTRLELKASVQEYLVSRRAEDFKTSQALFQSIFESVTVGIALINREGLIVDANHVLQEMSGYNIDELRGKTIDYLLDCNSAAEENSTAVENPFHSEASAFTIEGQCCQKNGQRIHCRLMCSSIEQVDEHGLAIVIIEDLTEKKQNQAAILQAEKMSITGKLAASLIHEINNPLQSAIGCLGLTEEVVNEGGDISKYLRVASEELERAARIVAQLRDLNQPAGLANNRSVRIQDLLEHTLMLVRKQCKDRGIQVTFHQRNEDLLLPLVPERMQQVFLNLVLNAIDSMIEGGELDIYPIPTHSPDGVSISFIDTGSGMPEDVLQHIYDPFYSTKTGGLGLGLYISKSIVQEYGGKIDVKSYPGRGTTFTVWFPA